MHVVDNVDDFIKYFHGSYIAKRAANGDMMPYYVRGGAGGTSVILRERSSQANNETFSIKQILEGFKLTAPPLGAISSTYGLVYISVTPERQYCKGLTDRRMHIFSFCDSVDASAILSEDLVYKIYNNTIYDPYVLLKHFSEGERLGGAISHKIGLYIKPKIKTPILTYKTQIIGCVMDDKVKVLSKFEHYKPYVEKLFAQSSIILWK